MTQYKHSVSLDVSKCKGCITCLKRCPTEAIRIKDCHATIDPSLCIDCGQCILSCPHKAKVAVNDKLCDIPFKDKYVIALPAPALYGQFANLDDADYLMQGLLDLGFSHVYEVARAAELVTEFTREYLKRTDIEKPVISSACPVVTRLISIRFPCLKDNLIPILPPMEIAAKVSREEALERHPELSPEDVVTVFISPCTAKTSYVKNGFAGQKSNVDYVVAMNDIYFELLGVMSKTSTPEQGSRAGMVGMSWAVSSGEASALLNDRYLAADGIENIIKVLDELETGNFPYVDYIELNACSSGCVGGALAVENPYIAKVKIQNLKRYLPVMMNRFPKEEVSEIPPKYTPTSFDAPDRAQKADRAAAMDLMKKAQGIYSMLPEFDCGACGSPNCHAFAKDVAKGNASIEECVMLDKRKKGDDPNDG